MTISIEHYETVRKLIAKDGFVTSVTLARKLGTSMNGAQKLLRDYARNGFLKKIKGYDGRAVKYTLTKKTPTAPVVNPNKDPSDDEVIAYIQRSNGRSRQDLMSRFWWDHDKLVAKLESLRRKNYVIEEIENLIIVKSSPTRIMQPCAIDWSGCQEISFGVVSDPHYGSKYAQPEYMIMAYKEYKARGITRVFMCGDISDGYYKHREEQIYQLHCFGADQQVDHIVKVYPKIKGITTYFITGNHDHTHLRNGGVDIGKAIAMKRPDMIYLGPNERRIMLTPNCRVDLCHPDDRMNQYSMSYAVQRFIESLDGGDKPNILFCGHYHKTLQIFYRNIHAFLVPAMQQQTPFLRGKRISVSLGFYIITVKVDKEGTVKSVLSELISFYQPYHETSMEVSQ